MSNESCLLTEVAHGVLTLTLNRPEVLNAFDEALIERMSEALKAAGRDRSVRCVVVRGAGRAFSAGGDVKTMRERPAGYLLGEHLRKTYHPLIRQLVTIEKPIIAALGGVAAGAGCSVALACDLRVASDKASLMLAFTKIGLIPDCGLNWLLPRLIGQARAYELALTAERISAEQALVWGLVNRVVPEAEFEGAVTRLATQLAAGPTRAFGLTKRAMWRSWEQDFGGALDYEAELDNVIGQTHDHQEGVRAFVEKRPAVFTGN